MEFISQNAGMIGLFFFFILFGILISWLFRPGAKSKYKEYGNIPFKTQDNSGEIQ